MDDGVIRNADIVFLYDAKLTNPNGDPDDENRPRMDPFTRRALVSDVRLKRYLRDYWIGQGLDVWVRTREDGTRLDASTRLEDLRQAYAQETGQQAGRRTRDEAGFRDWFLDRLIDVRLFGATLPIKAEDGGRGLSEQYTGPVQFAWGYSLHEVELNPSNSITSTFAGRGGEKGEYGTIGKDWRLLYALIGFWGHVASQRARHTRMTPADLTTLEQGLLRCLTSEATTRSKVGQTPRLYVRVDWRDHSPPFGDPRDGLKLLPVSEELPVERWRSIEEYVLDLQPLVDRLMRYRDQIAGIRYWRHDELNVRGEELLRALDGFSMVRA
ncbi:type I-B CRISPR-associated protein Cas7/Csh2 [Thermomicrobiaceae bacterium CFH 74404]|uniref:Type I-B CRISPR-associated protein Cas7/Csh2 n=1 Tax=Thermalbibacter longus TaxID=2951981 RepID=A0AA41WCD5_9BACT|nr:type I-B CRISPR-associated protein Cas7/Csh2 [Thermalbibacter longus]MCM8747879.1 type I-B CRISPR-associated protein Cas7/Csh2 [Thermalbibacter longus]